MTTKRTLQPQFLTLRAVQVILLPFSQGLRLESTIKTRWKATPCTIT